MNLLPLMIWNWIMKFDWGSTLFQYFTPSLCFTLLNTSSLPAHICIWSSTVCAVVNYRQGKFFDIDSISKCREMLLSIKNAFRFVSHDLLLVSCWNREENKKSTGRQHINFTFPQGKSRPPFTEISMLDCVWVLIKKSWIYTIVCHIKQMWAI